MTTDAGTTTDRYAEAAVTAAAEARGEPGWLRDRRAEAARAFDATPLPTRALRPWRYTDVTGLDFGAFAPTAAALSIDASVPDGAYAGTIRDALGAHGALLRDGLGSLTPATEGKFQAANAALWDDGVFVHAPARSAFDEPVVAELEVPAGDAAVFPRVLVVAGEQAEVTVVLRLRSTDAPLLAAGVVEIEAAQAARVRLLIDDRWGADTQDYTTVRARLARDADLQVASLAIGGRVIKQTVEVTLEGEGANSAIRAVALGDEDQHFDFVTLQDHTGPRTTSDVEVKAALAGASRSIYYGITRVGEDAAGAEANQQNRNLLLSNSSKADSDPVLEILTADVIRCGHGATVGPVDEEALFYLQSRGLDRRTSLQLLVSGFFQTVLRDIRLEGVAEELEETVFAKLARAEL
ncbi:MAG: Fe-S cluster assembly protein SufD [Chloroflexi bacterium]|nr:Fe-S cluster assembly protein SufD [Chloroflexota bacterium]